MIVRVASLALVVATALLSPVGGEAIAGEVTQAKPKATKASVLALKVKLEKARDAMRALAKEVAPKGLTADQRKIFDQEMAKVAADAEATDKVTKKLDELLKDSKANLDSMSQVGETESLRLQMAMDRMSKAMSAASNVFKKISDTAGGIIQNLK